MSGAVNRAKKEEVEARRKRVNRIKKMMIITIVVFLLLPSLLCLTLWIKVVHLEKKLDQFAEAYALQVDMDSYIETENKAYAADVEEQQDLGEELEPGEVDQTLLEGKKVYLTFDDGPSENTEKILDILSEYDVKATFFVIGRTDDASKDIYQRIRREGHTLAMHSYTHQYQKIYASKNAYKRDLEKLSDLLFDVTGEKCKFIRFPGGSSNTVSKVPMKEIIRYTNSEGYIYYDWNVINGDATGRNLTDKQMVNSVVSGVKSYENSVVLMHDCVGKEQTVKTLPLIIKKLQKMNVNILPINDTTTPVQHIKASDVN